MKQFLLFLGLFPCFLFCQIQIGDDLDGKAANDRFGTSVSLSFDGNMVAIGAPYNSGNGLYSGQVRVFKNLNKVWTQVGLDINGEASGDTSGSSISLSSDGSVVAIGAPYNEGNGSTSGHVRVFKNINDSWTQIGQDIDSEASGDYFGWTTSLSSNGSVLAISGIYNAGINGLASGHVRVFKNINDSWTQIGQDLDGEAVGDAFGTNLALSSNGLVVAIGTPKNDGNGTNSGHVRVFENINDSWIQIGTDLDGENPGDRSGAVSLSSDGSIIAIGSGSYSGVNGASSGHVRVFKNSGGTWTQIGQNIDGEAAYDTSGANLSLSGDGNILAISAIQNSGVNGTYSGHVRIFKNINDVWTQIGTDIDGESANNYSGAGISLSADGSTVAVGAIFNSDNGDSSGHVRIYDLTAILSAESFKQDYFNYYPNPVKDILHINLNPGLELKCVNIYNIQSQYLYSVQSKTINLNQLNSGYYFIEVETNRGKSAKKIIKD